MVETKLQVYIPSSYMVCTCSVIVSCLFLCCNLLDWLASESVAIEIDHLICYNVMLLKENPSTCCLYNDNYISNIFLHNYFIDYENSLMPSFGIEICNELTIFTNNIWVVIIVIVPSKTTIMWNMPVHIVVKNNRQIYNKLF